MNVRTTDDRSARFALMGLLAVQAVIGYEWLASGLTKVVRGGFPSGLAEELTQKSKGVGGWYGSFLQDVVIPNGPTFGYLIMIGELLVGIALVGGALVWLVARERLDVGGRMLVALVVALGAFGGIFMNVSFHLANAFSHPWLIPKSGFDEGVDLDSLMPAIELALIAFSLATIASLRRARASTTARAGGERGARAAEAAR